MKPILVAVLEPSLRPFPQLPGTPHHVFPKPADALEATSHPRYVLGDDKGTKNSSGARGGWDILQQERSRIALEVGITGQLLPLGDGGDQNIPLEHQDPSPPPI